MAAYYVNEAAFTLPDIGFVDRTLHRLESPLSGDDLLKVEIRRLPVEHGRRLRELIDEDTAVTKAKASGYTILDEIDAALGGLPAVLLRARFRANDVAYYQLKAHVLVESTWVLLLVSGPYSDRAAADETFERVVQSLEWRGT
jgi:hypothetical protein